jgi:alkylation response protein AidB-like acyl-CoA dehydrogenase
LSDREQRQSIRDGVRRICSGFPDSYWREIDRREEYPHAFVKALTDSGYLAALIPEEYEGAGLGMVEASIILEEINRSGGNALACHAQMYTMGALLKHGSPEQKRRYLPAIARGELRLQAFAVTEPNAGSETTRLETHAARKGDRYVVNGQNLARQAVGLDAVARAHHALRRAAGQDAGAVGVSAGPQGHPRQAGSASA